MQYKETVMGLHPIFWSVRSGYKAILDNQSLITTQRTNVSPFLCNGEFIMKHFKMYHLKFPSHVMLHQSHTLLF
jgi:hypothetical protein